MLAAFAGAFFAADFAGAFAAAPFAGAFLDVLEAPLLTDLLGGLAADFVGALEADLVVDAVLRAVLVLDAALVDLLVGASAPFARPVVLVAVVVFRGVAAATDRET